jgi:hypothetical protein
MAPQLRAMTGAHGAELDLRCVFMSAGAAWHSYPATPAQVPSKNKSLCSAACFR